MTQPAPGYQPYQPMSPMMGVAAPPKQSRGGLTTLLAGILALVTAGLAIGGSFAPISSFRNSYDLDGEETVFATTTSWWSYSDDGSTSAVDGEDILSGLTLVLAATLLVLGAVFAFLAARSRRFGPTSGARSLISAGVGVLAGVSLLQLLTLLKQTEAYNERELEAGESLDFTTGLGMWLPLAGVLLGVVAVVLAHVGQRPRGLRVEPNTPRMGFPAPYGYRGQRGPGMHPGAPQTQVPPSERPTEVEFDDAADTQRVSGATASGEPPADESSAATDSTGNDSPKDAGTDSASSDGASDAPAVAAPDVPAPPAATAPPAAPALPAPQAPPAAPDTPAATGPGAEPATPQSPATATGAAGPAAEQESRTPLTDLPSAPPAPELSSSDESKKDEK